MSINQFRYLALLSVLFNLASALVDHVFPALMPEPLKEALLSESAKASDPKGFELWLIGTYLVVLIASICAALYGVFRFRPWAPRLAVFATASMVFVYFIPNVNSIGSGLSNSLGSIGETLWGATLAAMYFSSIKKCFQTVRE